MWSEEDLYKFIPGYSCGERGEFVSDAMTACRQPRNWAPPGGFALEMASQFGAHGFRRRNCYEAQVVVDVLPPSISIRRKIPCDLQLATAERTLKAPGKTTVQIRKWREGNA